MILAVFKLGGEHIESVVDKGNLFFRDLSSGTMTTIEGIKINKSGVLKEFPDLENNEEWKKIALERLKAHLKKLNTESKKIDYIRFELEKHGYEPLYKQRAGFRPEKFK